MLQEYATTYIDYTLDENGFPTLDSPTQDTSSPIMGQLEDDDQPIYPTTIIDMRRQAEPGNHTQVLLCQAVYSKTRDPKSSLGEKQTMSLGTRNGSLD